MDIIIQNSSDKPIYQQIVDQVKDKVLTGVLQPGEALPSMRLLARELKISVITTKRAYEELEREGFLTTQPGRGSFVAEKNLEFAREERMRALEESLAKAVELARGCGVSERELVQLVTLLYSGE
ncbi:GntR family transcriptional regulator [Acetanaerobacterium sp. MSJ-12]|uniref:GntR family transcriptional regulator n=1 Tax=Bittarella massiliensis (ex Durand et al. 2017) TaxID=1720313 RepID=A0AAQ1RVC3_9FIRM|nr:MULTISPECIES: GntR family transcriptional regulator [Eubacteriales]MCB5941746.1 GntR family transcriptional regulator [bacterium 210820-DFI.6.52]ERI97496.1 transcriptional regulator, GntR family [Clostridium sp. ATCC 29733]MBC2870400.1 GntR family transcriptional regulator [Bittarella massiliensis (ex Durand et al. 2017)]MBU5420205.1 GntR family transcriptional regulator [Acetanaerobacterium sp. MSJ-12]MCQ4949981.1 GntR family transcriptional regulator [Bittarella massiliensis (ex Durand et